MEFPFETDYVKVFFHESTATAWLEWNRPVNVKEYQEGVNAFFALFNETGASRGLMDISRRGSLDLDADSWVFKKLQETPQQDATVFQVALVMTEQKYQELIQCYSPLQSGSIDQVVRINYFTSQKEAEDWLANSDLVSI